MREFHEIYERYGNDVYRYLLCLTKDKDLAEEFTQETFYRAIKNIKKFNGKSSMYSFLCAIGRNAFFDYLRKNKKIDRNVEVNEILYEYKTPEEICSDLEVNENLYREIEKLDSPGREILKLHLIFDVSLKAISEIYGKSESFARVVLFRARKKLKERLRKYDEGV